VLAIVIRLAGWERVRNAWRGEGGARAAEERDENGKAENDAEDEERRERWDAEDFGADDASENVPNCVTECATDKGQQELFCCEKETDHSRAGAEGLHEGELGAALDDAGGGRGSNGERGGEKCGERNEPEQRTNTSEDLAFAIGDAMDDADVRAGKNLLDGIGDRGNVRGAGPSFKFVSIHRFGIAAAEGVFGLSEREDVKLAVLSGLSGKNLRNGQRRYDRIVFRAPCAQNSDDLENSP